MRTGNQRRIGVRIAATVRIVAGKDKIRDSALRLDDRTGAPTFEGGVQYAVGQLHCGNFVANVADNAMADIEAGIAHVAFDGNRDQIAGHEL